MVATCVDLDLEDEPIYLTSTSPNLDTAAATYLRKEIVDAEASSVMLVEGPDFVIERDGYGAEPELDEEGNEIAPTLGALHLKDVPGGKSEKTSEIEKAGGALGPPAVRRGLCGRRP